jgi:hypothetical protein
MRLVEDDKPGNGTAKVLTGKALIFFIGSLVPFCDW